MSRLRLLLIAVALLPGAVFSAPDLAWERTDTSLALHNGTNTVWRLVFDPAQPKSYFHPLATLDGGVLTAYRPADHVWHRGLWWSWKFINGLNYWEEDKTSGRSQGVNELVSASVTTNADFSASAELAFSNHPPEKPALLTEVRRLRVSAPDSKGCYRIDWDAEFTAGAEPVKLDRTPPPAEGGPAWGGYAGLSMRFPPGFKEGAFLTSGGEVAASASGKPAQWVDFSGAAGGVAIFDAPGNLRHPQPFYLSQQLPFFQPALLFDKPLELAPGQKVSLRYRVLIHPAGVGREVLQAEWEAMK